MSSTSRPTLEQIALWAKVSLAVGGSLDRVLTDRHVLDVCGFAQKWKTLASYLGLTQTEQEDLAEDGPYALRRKELMLKEWRSINGQNASYRRLGKAFLDMGSSENAQKVFELSKVTSLPNSSATSAHGSLVSALVSCMEDVGEWYHLGVRLDLPTKKLQSIRKKFDDDSEGALGAMLDLWLKGMSSDSISSEGIDPELLKRLATYLREMSYGKAANEVEMNFLKRES